MNAEAPAKTGQSGQVPLGIVGVLALALLLRLVHLSSAVVSPLSFQLGADEDYYLRFGRAVAAGVGQDSPEFTFMDPGYGYLIGGLFRLFGPGVFAPYLLQCFLDGFTALAIVLIGRQLSRPRAGVIGGILYAACSSAMMFSCSLLKEVWVAAFMTWWVVIALHLLRSERTVAWAAFGVFCGVAIAFRSTLLLLAVAAIALPWLSGPLLHAATMHRGKRTMMFATGMLLALVPWSVRNFEAYHSLSPLPHNGGVVLHQTYNLQNVDSAMWIPDFVHYLNPSEIWRGYAAEAERRMGRPLRADEVDGYWRSQAFDFMRQNPRAVLGDVGNKSLDFVASADIPVNRSLREEALFSWSLAWLPAAAPWLMALGLTGLIWLGLEDRRWWLLAVPPAIALLTTAVFWAEDRFRFHAFAILALCAGVWLDGMMRDIQSRQLKPILTFGIGAAALLTASFASGSRVNVPAMHWDQIVWGYIKMGRPREAELTADHALRDQPDSAPLLEAQGYLALMRRDYTGAADAYEHALRVRPTSDQAHYNLAKLYMALNKPQEALMQAKMAMDLNPEPDYSKLVAELQARQ